jgi:N-acetylmuramoyl-L-alanine amidase
MKALLIFLVAGFVFHASAEAGNPLGPLIDVSGAQWRGSKYQPVVDRLKPHSAKPTKLTIHYTGVKQNSKRKIEEKIRNLFHFSVDVIELPMKKKKWGDVPYHFYLDMYGKVAEGRDTRWQPDTNTNYDPDGHITVVVEGDNTDSLTDDQKGKLFALMRAIQLSWGIPMSNVGVHKDYASTACPGASVAAAVQQYKQGPAPKKAK